MTRTELIDVLLVGIEKSTAEKSDSVTISKGEAREILSLLAGMGEESPPQSEKDGQVLFFCPDCGKSFWADPREDPDCFEKWHYHRWFANCPLCGAEVMQNDRYWR